jgi:metallo-beta-lactamase family protein
MKISFLGAAKTVTGSCFYIETNSCNFIVDCGMFQGSSVDETLNDEEFTFSPAELDFVLLTHAHIDHSGRIPKLYVEGFKGQVYATKAAVELCAIMLPDSGHIQEFENEWVNRKRKRAGLQPIEPMYTNQDAIDSMSLFTSVRYGDVVRPHSSVKVRFNDAGHMLGSAIIEIWVEEDGEEVKLVFTGDLGNKNMPILRDPAFINSADYLFIESTYGNRSHMNVENKMDRLVEIIDSTIKKGGKIIIPSFAVGRTQEIIYELFKQQEKYEDMIDKIMRIPVYVDSPLAVSATEVFRNNLDCFDEEARAYIANGDNPLDFPGLHFTRSADESKQLNVSEESMIIISASGMCDAGRIKHHLKHNLWRKESSVLFVGYQAEGSTGRRLVDGVKKIRIFGEEISVNARIEMLEGFSGHADKEGLIDWIKHIIKKPSKVFIVHGEEESMNEFSDMINSELKIETIIPNREEAFIVNKEGVFKADKTTVIPKKKEERRYLRLEVVDLLDKLQAEIEEASSIVRNDLKNETDDIQVEELRAKLLNFEKYIVDMIE